MTESNQAPIGNITGGRGRRKRRGSDPFADADSSLVGLVFDAPGAIASGIREAGKGMRGLTERVTGTGGDDDNAGGFGSVLEATASIASAAGDLLASAGSVAGDALSGAVDAAGPVAEAVGEVAGEAAGAILENLGDVLN